MNRTTICLILLTLVTSRASAETVIDLEEMTLFSGTSGATDGQPGGLYYNGNDGSGRSNSDGWSSKGVGFSNLYDDSFDYWQGWSYSNVVNPVTPGFANQYAAFPGGGSNGTGGVDAGGIYAVANTGSVVDETVSLIHFDRATRVSSLDLANTTYFARWTEGLAPPFAPNPGNFGDGDYVRLRIEGIDQNRHVISSHSETLADFGGEGESDDFLLANWRTTDLTDLGTVWGLRFIVDSNRTSTFDNVTYVDPPAYFAVDNIRLTAVPEPSAAGLGALACAACAWRARRARAGFATQRL